MPLLHKASAASITFKFRDELIWVKGGRAAEMPPPAPPFGPDPNT